MYYRDKYSFSEIARRTSLSRNTIKKWLRQPESRMPKYRRDDGEKKIAPYATRLNQALEADAHRPKRERRTAKRLWEEIRSQGFVGDYSRVTEFVRDWHSGLVIGGVYRRLQVAHLKLCASKAFVLMAYPSQAHEMLFDTDFCNVASGWEKGVVEKNVQDSRRRIWIDAQQERFSSFLELNLWFLARCRALWAEIRHPQYQELTVLEVLELEREHLMPMPAWFDGYIESQHKVSSTCLVAVAKNRYSVPCEFAGQRISARLYPDRVDLVSGDIVIASHLRPLNAKQVCYDWQHYIPILERKPGALRNGAPFADLPEALQQLQRELLKREQGDKIKVNRPGKRGG
jgi:predicted DNA-binding protein YlxM (UPF0122 family)